MDSEYLCYETKTVAPVRGALWSKETDLGKPFIKCRRKCTGVCIEAFAATDKWNQDADGDNPSSQRMQCGEILIYLLYRGTSVHPCHGDTYEGYVIDEPLNL